MRTTDRLWIAVAFAGGLGSLTLLPLTQDTGYLAPVWVMVAVLAGVAIGAERLRVAKPLTTLVQFVLTVVMFLMLAAGAGRQDLSWWQRLLPLVRTGYDHIRSTEAPMPPNDGVQLIFVMMTVLLTLTAGILADPLERPSFTLAPLLTLYLVPAVALRTDVQALSFLSVVVGYLAILLADGMNTDRRWTRNLTSDSVGRSRGSGGVWRVAALVAVPALVGAVLLGLMLPTFSPTFVSSLRPNGSGPIEMADPQLDLRRNLQQPENRVVLTYTTNKPNGTYLRQATLPVLSAAGWQQSQVSLRQGAIGAVPGVGSAPGGGSRQTQLEIGELRSMYLPAPYAPRAQSAPGEWSWDPSSLMIIATGQDRNRATEGLRYNVESWDIVPDGEVLSAARTGVPDGATATMEIPSDVPQSIVKLTGDITANIDSPALKAAAIQAYLRGPQFKYSVQGASGDTNYQALETFLTKTRTGYCVQFAGSMALMARIAGIPSRVAVGFLPGQKVGDRYQVTAHDMHAWPELYFEGLGWVRFEPTPSVATAPPWTVVAPNQPSAPPTTAAPSAEPSVEPSAAAPTEAPTTEVTPPVGPEAARTPVGRYLAMAALGLVVLAVLLAPMVVRVLTRRSRLRGTGDPAVDVDTAWAEVRDTWLDLGRTWPLGSPRQAGAAVSESLHDDESKAALTGLVTTVERSRYARTVGSTAELEAQTTRLLNGLRSGMTWDTALLARFFPRSVQQRLQDWVEQQRQAVRARVSRPEESAEPAPQGEGQARDDASFRPPVGAGRR